MARIRKAAPREDGGDSAWTWIAVPEPCDWVAWIAGPAVWIEGHHMGATRPCRDWMTSGELPCQFDHVKTRLVQSGYLPIHHQSGKRYFISVMEYSRPAIDKLHLWAEVRILRGKEDKGPITIIQKPGANLWHRRHNEPSRGHDISEALLTLWKDEALARWCRANPATEADAPPPPPPPPPPRWTPDPELHEDIRDIYRGGGDTPPTAADSLGEVFKKRGIKAPPSPNGKHD